VTKLQNKTDVGKFAILAIWKHCDAVTGQITRQRWVLVAEVTLETSWRFLTARFTNLGGFEEILRISIKRMP